MPTRKLSTEIIAHRALFRGYRSEVSHCQGDNSQWTKSHKSAGSAGRTLHRGAAPQRTNGGEDVYIYKALPPYSLFLIPGATLVAPPLCFFLSRCTRHHCSFVSLPHISYWSDFLLFTITHVTVWFRESKGGKTRSFLRPSGVRRGGGRGRGGPSGSRHAISSRHKRRFFLFAQEEARGINHSKWKSAAILKRKDGRGWWRAKDLCVHSAPAAAGAHTQHSGPARRRHGDEKRCGVLTSNR